MRTPGPFGTRGAESDDDTVVSLCEEVGSEVSEGLWSDGSDFLGEVEADFSREAGVDCSGKGSLDVASGKARISESM